MMKAKQIFNIKHTLITGAGGAYGAMAVPTFANRIGKSIWHRVTEVNTISGGVRATGRRIVSGVH